MALPPYYDDPEQVRPHFRKLRELLHRLRERTATPEKLSELSMGMSHDFEVAIEEGATMIRIGTALFGTRPAFRSRQLLALHFGQGDGTGGCRIQGLDRPAGRDAHQKVAVLAN